MMQEEDFAIAEEMVREIYRHKIYGKEKYAQLMRVLPYIVRQKERGRQKKRGEHKRGRRGQGREKKKKTKKKKQGEHKRRQKERT